MILILEEREKEREREIKKERKRERERESPLHNFVAKSVRISKEGSSSKFCITEQTKRVQVLHLTGLSSTIQN
jgi:hypothetical protein